MENIRNEDGSLNVNRLMKIKNEIGDARFKLLINSSFGCKNPTKPLLQELLEQEKQSCQNYKSKEQ